MQKLLDIFDRAQSRFGGDAERAAPQCRLAKPIEDIGLIAECTEFVESHFGQFDFLDEILLAEKAVQKNSASRAYLFSGLLRCEPEMLG